MLKPLHAGTGFLLPGRMEHHRWNAPKTECVGALITSLSLLYSTFCKWVLSPPFQVNLAYFQVSSMQCLAGRRWDVIKGITLAYTHYLKAPVKESCTYIVLVCFNKYHTGLDFQSWDIHIRQSFPVTSLMLFNVLSVTSEITSNSQPLFWLEMPKLHIIKTCTDPMNCVMLFPKRWYCTAGLCGGRFHIKTFASALWKSWRYFWGLPDKVKLHNHSEMTLYTHWISEYGVLGVVNIQGERVVVPLWQVICCNGN